jgi:PBP1b-binding outer membrane lipoprotein LpoB
MTYNGDEPFINVNKKHIYFILLFLLFFFQSCSYNQDNIGQFYTDITMFESFINTKKKYIASMFIFLFIFHI